jgi:hypothetical protein
MYLGANDSASLIYQMHTLAGEYRISHASTALTVRHEKTQENWHNMQRSTVQLQLDG